MGITNANSEVWVIGAAGIACLASTFLLLVRWPRLRLSKN
jgi:hypothetical protein